MPYGIVPLGNHRYRVINLETGSVNAKSTTLQKALAQVRLLNAKGYLGHHESIYGPEYPTLSGSGDFYGGLTCATGTCCCAESTIKPFGYGAGEIPAADEIYLALSSEAYKIRDGRDPEVKGFVYDRDLSSRYTAVYVGPDRIIIAARGTVPSDPEDLKADALIVAGQFAKSDRLKKSIKDVEAVVQKYPGKRLEFTGHSLGGKVASELGKAVGGKVVTFNMGTSPLEIAQSLKDKAICAFSNSENCKRLKQQTHYTTGVDPISFASLFMHGSKHVKAEKANVHGLANFRPSK